VHAQGHHATPQACPAGAGVAAAPARCVHRGVFMKFLADLVQPRKSVFDRNRRDTVQDLRDLAKNRIDADEFFSETFVTAGMRTLLTEALRRLAGKSERGVFKLTQAMGGGKTHNLIALGLLASRPDLRHKVLGRDYPGGVDQVRVVAFSGRECDIPFGIWGEIAGQLGKREHFAEHYQPLLAPGKTAWETLLGSEPTLILLDELPPYLDNARSIAIGDTNLAQVTATALANLFDAVGSGGLTNVCIVLTDLVGVYEEATEAIQKTLSTLQKEAERHCMDLVPVQIGSDEFYDILRTRLFEVLPDESLKGEVAAGYGQAIQTALSINLTAQSPEQFAEQVRRSYPFHPTIKDLYARFRENKGFQQTRALIRVMRIVVQSLWETGRAKSKYLIAAHDIDLGSSEILSEIRQINASLDNAIAKDISANGDAAAEGLDRNRGGRDARDACTLLFMSSLANVPNAVVGLTLPEVVAYLSEPGRQLDRLAGEVLEPLATAAWYLHAGRDNRMYFRNVENLNAKLETYARTYLQDHCVAEVRTRLQDMFKPRASLAYQVLAALPGPDEVAPAMDKITLVVTEPVEGNHLNPTLEALWKNCKHPNRLAFLTGHKNTFSAVTEAARRLKALQTILTEMNDAGVPETDAQRREANQLLDRFRQQFNSAAREAFTRLWYPSRQQEQDKLVPADFLMEFQGNDYNGEEQILKVLRDKRKFDDEVASEGFRRKVEGRLFTVQRMLWSEVKNRAASNVGWVWYRSDALEKLKADAVHKDLWREEGAYVDKGPHPKPDTDVLVQLLNRDDATGVAELRVTPVRGDKVNYDVGAAATNASKAVVGNTLKTAELQVSFVCIDTKGVHATGPAKTWKNQLKLRYSLIGGPGHYEVRLEHVPAVDAVVRYTTNGANPRNLGGVYEAPFAVPPQTRIVQAIALFEDFESDVLRIDIPLPVDGPPGPPPVVIDPERPLDWFEWTTADSNQAAYELFDRLTRLNATGVGPKLVANADIRWMELTSEDSVQVTGPQLLDMANQIRQLVDDAPITLTLRGLRFGRGADALAWARETKTELRPGSFTQN
jgi:hypothetical protein